MAELILHFNLPASADQEQAAQQIRDRLSRIEGISDIAAKPEEPRLTGLEVAAAIAVAVVIVKGTTNLVRATRALISEVRGLANDLSTDGPEHKASGEGGQPLSKTEVALVDVTVEYKETRISLVHTELTDAQIEELFKG